jgi:hypothetical protein
LHLEIENEGDGLLEYEITRIKEKENKAIRDDEERPARKRTPHSNWLSITPLRGVIKAGEKKQISFRVQIT